MTKEGEVPGLNYNYDGPQRHLEKFQKVTGGPIVNPDADLPYSVMI